MSGFNRGYEEARGYTEWEERGRAAVEDDDDVCLGRDGEVGRAGFFKG